MRFSLRTALAVVTLAAVVCGMWISQARRQRSAVEAIRNKGGTATYASDPARFMWLAKLIGKDTWLASDLFYAVIGVNLNGTEFSDQDAVHLKPLRDLAHLNLTGARITDETLKVVSRCRDLEAVWLGNTRISDEGLAHLRHHEKLIMLVLAGTSIDGSGFKYLKGLDRLQSLAVQNTLVDDDDLPDVLSLRGLQALDVTGTSVSLEGIERLQTQFPTLAVIDAENRTVPAKAATPAAVAGPSG